MRARFTRHALEAACCAWCETWAMRARFTRHALEAASGTWYETWANESRARIKYGKDEDDNDQVDVWCFLERKSALN